MEYQPYQQILEAARREYASGRGEHAARGAEGTMHGARQDSSVKPPMVITGIPLKK